MLRGIVGSLLFLAVAASASAQSGSFLRYYPPASGGVGAAWDGGAFTDPAEGPDGCTNPAYGFGATDTDAGLCLDGANDVYVQTAPGTTSSARLRMTTGTSTFFTYDGGGLANGVQASATSSSVILVSGNNNNHIASASSFYSLTPFVFEGATANDFETTLTVTDPTADRTITLPNASGTMLLSAGTGFAVDTDGSGTMAARSLTNTDGCITVQNGNGASANPIINIDTTCVLTFSSGTGSVSATGAIGEFYFETDRPAVYTYPATDAETVLLSLPAGTGNSGGIPYFTATADVIASSAALTANAPVIGGGAGSAPSVGTRSGNTTAFVTTTGTQTSGDCVSIDANGNHVASGAACGGSSFDPGTQLTLYCEFVSAGLLTAGNLGECGLFGAAVATGTANFPGSPDAGNPGLLRLLSHATNDNSGWYVATANGVGLAVDGSDWTGENWTLDAVAILGSNGTAITNTSFYFGLSNTLTDPATGSAGIWIRRDTDDSDTAFVFAICDSATTGCNSAGDDTNQDTVLSTITPSAGTAYRFRIRRLTSGVGGNPTYYFRVNDETEKTFCSSGCDEDLGNLPSAPGAVLVSHLTRTTSGVLSTDLDYLYLSISGLARY